MNGEHTKKHEIIDSRLKILHQELDIVELEVELQAAIVRNLAEGVVLVKVSDGIIVYANPHLNCVFGYDEDELKGQHVSVLNASPSEKVRKEETNALMLELRANPSSTRQLKMAGSTKNGTKVEHLVRISTFEHKTHGKVWVALHNSIE